MIISIGFNDCVDLNIVCNIIYHGFVLISNSSEIIFYALKEILNLLYTMYFIELITDLYKNNS